MTDADLPFEVEAWNPAESEVWVRVPLLPAGSTTTSIVMSFGADDGFAPNGAATWAGFELVEHMAATLANSVGGTYAASRTSTGTGAGQIADALTFSGSGSEQVNFAGAGQLFDGWPKFTLEFWIYPDYADPMQLEDPVHREPQFMDKGGPLRGGRLYTPGQNGTSINLQIDFHFTGGSANDSYLATEVKPMTWTDIVYTFDHENLTLYQDGLEVITKKMTAAGQSLAGSSSSFLLGDTGGAMAGMLDELRIEQTEHSADWVMAQHRSMVRELVTIQP